MMQSGSTSWRKRLVPFFVLFLHFVCVCEAQFGRKKGKKDQDLAEQAAGSGSPEQQSSEPESAPETVELFGFEVDKAIFYGVTLFLAVVLSAGIVFQLDAEKKRKKGNRPNTPGTVDVVVVGTGMPKRGMGWYHLTQLLEMKTVNVRAIVEPFFLNPELCKNVPESFVKLTESLDEADVEMVKSVDDLRPFRRPTMCLIAGRTPDNPKFFAQCVAKGASVIYLEKPGAPSVAELEKMKNLADKAGTKVYIGYNKNVSKYVQKTVDLARKIPNSMVYFCHNNAYQKADLPECFARNSEGMMKNMAIHELALLVTFFDVRVESIDKFKVNTDKLFSEKLTVWKPGTTLPKPEYVSDFSRAAFKIITKDGSNVAVMADRCGGNFSFAVVKDESGKEVQKFEFPDQETQSKVDEQCKQDPEMMPYFFLQSDDYLELKTRVVNSMLAGTDAAGLATIDIGLNALKLAEFGTAQLNKALEAL